MRDKTSKLKSKLIVAYLHISNATRGHTIMHIKNREKNSHRVGGHVPRGHIWSCLCYPHPHIETARHRERSGTETPPPPPIVNFVPMLILLNRLSLSLSPSYPPSLSLSVCLSLSLSLSPSLLPHPLSLPPSLPLTPPPSLCPSRLRDFALAVKIIW